MAGIGTVLVLLVIEGALIWLNLVLIDSFVGGHPWFANVNDRSLIVIVTILTLVTAGVGLLGLIPAIPIYFITKSFAK